MTNQVGQNIVAVVMAGGVGERFWPLSRRNRPKQLLRLGSRSRSLLGQAVERIRPVVPPDDIYIVTGEHLVEPIRKASAGVPEKNVIAEPCKRNTAGCLAYSAAHILAQYDAKPEDIAMVVLTADHAIGDEETFCNTIRTALMAARSEEALVTLGIEPTRPETGYGYIEVNQARRPLPEYTHGAHVYRVEAFHEKPPQEKANAFVDSGHYFWNAGMFVWTLSTFLRELDEAAPRIAETVRAMIPAIRAEDREQVARIFETLEDISIDYALMERARHVLVVHADFPWDDVGAWSALDRTYPHDPDGNVAVGNPVLIDCSNSIVYSEPGEALAVSVIGMEDVVVIAADDAVLVMPKSRAQEVRRVVARLKERDSDRL